MPDPRASVAVKVSLSDDAESLLDRALELGSMSSSTAELLERTRRDDAEVGPVVEALARDPALTAAVLRAANSPAYGQSRMVGDLQRAVTVLGMQELHDVIAGTAMMATFTRTDPLSKQIQSTSVLSGAIARMLTTKLRAGSASTAYLGGLMCELGALACLALDPTYAALYRAGEHDAAARFAAESQRYGLSTPALAGRILAVSALPADVGEAVAETGFGEATAGSPLGRIVAFSRLAAHTLVAAAETGDLDALREALSALAARVRLGEIDGDTLTRICLQAAAAAELTLRGELSALSSTPHNDVAPAQSVSATRPSAAIVRYGALCAVGALVALLVWLLTR